MPILSVDVTIEQRRQLKTLSSFAGLSMREFILTRVFAEAAETVFAPKNKARTSNRQLQKAQELFFDKAEIIVVSPEKWEKVKKKTG